MSQPDQSNMQPTADDTAFKVCRDMGAEADVQKKSNKGVRHEWLPEDDDDWYEPDYWRRDYKTH